MRRLLLPDLRAHVDRYAEPGPDGLVFVGPRGGRLCASTFGPRVFAPAVRRLGLAGTHFHDLRHTGSPGSRDLRR